MYLHTENLPNNIYWAFACTIIYIVYVQLLMWTCIGWIYRLQVHHILNEIVMGGMVLETNTSEIITRIEEQGKLEKSEVSC